MMGLVRPLYFWDTFSWKIGGDEYLPFEVETHMSWGIVALDTLVEAYAIASSPRKAYK